MMLGENAGKGGERFFGTIFVIARDEDEVLPLSKALGPHVDEWLGEEGRKAKGEEGQECERSHW